jgi:cytidylate kinase
MIPVITISREFGSEGENIAERIAKTLGYHFVDKNVISDLLGQYGVVEFDREYETMPSFWERLISEREKSRDESVDMFNKVVRAIAHHGNVVILGRSGFEVLIDFADVLRVRLQAPFSVRVEEVMTQQKITREDAEALVKESDKVRMAYVEEFYRVPWEAIRAFDLVINTSKISPNNATAWVVNAVQAFVDCAETGKPMTRSIEVDPILAAAVSDKLRCKIAHI